MAKKLCNSPWWLTPAVCFLSVALLIICGGCEESIPVKRVRGKVTFNGQPPPKAGKIIFAAVSAADGLPARPASGEFETDGEFRLTTFKPGDGLIPGTYRVNILCFREPPTLETRVSANYVPPSFHPEIIVGLDDDEPLDITIDVPVDAG